MPTYPYAYERYSVNGILKAKKKQNNLFSVNKTSMPFKIIVNNNLSKIHKFVYNKTETITNKTLLQIITEINRWYKSQLQIIKTKGEDYRISNYISEILPSYTTSLLTDFTTLVLCISEYRTIWNAQFPDKEKKIKFHELKNKIGKNNTREEQGQYKIKVDLEYSYIFYDILRRIEKATNMQFMIHPNSGILYPIFYFTKVITLSSNKIPIVSYYYNEIVRENCEFLHNKWWDNTLINVIYDQNVTTKKKILIFDKQKIKICPNDGSKWTKNTKFNFISTLDLIGCPACELTESLYKQPKFTLNNIYHDNYHGNRSGFKFQVKKLGYEPSIPIGMELETELKLEKHLNKTRNDLLFTLWNALDKKDIIFERDGSLNSWGVECITNPMSLEYARSYWKKVETLLPQLTRGIYSGLAAHTPTDVSNYWGIHLTIKRSYFNNNIHLAKFNNFFYNPENKITLHLIGQRNYLYSTEDTLGETRSTKGKTIKQFNIDYNRKEPGEKIVYPARGTAVNLSKKRFIELRFFQSTNNVNEILKNYDFVTALYEWISFTNVGLMPTATDFFNWILDKNNPQRTKRYKYLVKFLQQETIQLRTSIGKIENRKNPFAELFNSVNINQFFNTKTKK